MTTSNLIKFQTILDEVANVMLEQDSNWIHVDYVPDDLMNVTIIFSSVCSNMMFKKLQKSWTSLEDSLTLAEEFWDELHKLILKFTDFNTKTFYNEPTQKTTTE